MTARREGAEKKPTEFIGDRRPNRQFAFAALSDVRGLRGGIIADVVQTKSEGLVPAQTTHLEIAEKSPPSSQSAYK